ncbi:MAG: serine/threonine protein kinase [Cyanophyceae cyanobacterium]
MDADEKRAMLKGDSLTTEIPAATVCTMNIPDFKRYGYQVIEPLGQNSGQGRLTYKALNFQGQTVVIKQFQFVTSTDWTGYKAVEREVEVLQALNHPGIPRILKTFDSGNGICLVQEYKDASPLSTPRRLTTEEVKSIAITVLEILVYLQQQVPPIIHRDIKPENVLVDDQLNVYLIDFGFARTNHQPGVALSSQVAGTFGFMPPEQLLNRPLTLATDLYSLGATLICLLSGTASTEIGTLIDNRFHFRWQPPAHLSRRWRQWLQKLVQPELKYRFSDASEALEALNDIDALDLPQTQINWLGAAKQIKFKETVGNWRSSLHQALLALRQSPRILLLWWLVCFTVTVLVAAVGISAWGTITGAIAGVALGALLGSGEEQLGKGVLAGASGGALAGAASGATAKIGAGLGISAVGGAVLGFALASIAIVIALDLLLTEQLKSNLSSSLLAITTGIGVGIGLRAGVSYLLLVLLSTVPLASVLIANRQRALDPAEISSE